MEKASHVVWHQQLIKKKKWDINGKLTATVRNLYKLKLKLQVLVKKTKQKRNPRNSHIHYIVLSCLIYLHLVSPSFILFFPQGGSCWKETTSPCCRVCLTKMMETSTQFHSLLPSFFLFRNVFVYIPWMMNLFCSFTFSILKIKLFFLKAVVHIFELFTIFWTHLL